MNTFSNRTGNFSGKFTGDKIPKGYKSGQLQQFTPEQMQLFQQLFSQVSPQSYLSRLSKGDESLFGEMEAPALKQFAGLQGNLASRFSQGGGAGSLSARNSSGFQNTMNQAGIDFASQLQSNRQNLQRQAIEDLMGLSNQLLNQRPYERTLNPKPKSWLQEAGIGLSSGFGQGVGSFLGKLTGGLF